MASTPITGMSDTDAEVEPVKTTAQKYIPPWKRAIEKRQSECPAQVKSDVEEQAGDAITRVETIDSTPLATYDAGTLALRQNLIYKVIPKSSYNFAKSIVQCLSRFPGESGVIFCRTRWHNDFFATQLRSEGISAEPYHSGVVGKPRSIIEQRWADGDIRVLCSTVAHRAATNLPNVRFVIYRTMAESIYKYCRGLSMVGLDGKPSVCIVLREETNKGRLFNLMEHWRSYRNESPAGFEAMLAYSGNTEKCRRKMLADLIEPGNSVEACADDESACDICKPDVPDSSSEGEDECDT